MAMRLLALLACLSLIGCDRSDGEVDSGSGGAGSDAATADGGPDGDAAACGDVGAPCESACPDDLRCYESVAGGFCAPERAECGGFSGAVCPEERLLCVTLAGNTAGACLTTEEKDCVCARGPDTVEGC